MEERELTHTTDECTGMWRLQVGPKEWAVGDDINSSLIVCRTCGKSYLFTQDLHLQMVKENLFGLHALTATQQGQALLDNDS